MQLLWICAKFDLHLQFSSQKVWVKIIILLEREDLLLTYFFKDES